MSAINFTSPKPVLRDNRKNFDWMSLMDSDSVCSQENFAANLVYEFLRSYEFKETLTSFVEECNNMGFVLNEPTTLKEKIQRQDVCKIQKVFLENSDMEFFNKESEKMEDPSNTNFCNENSGLKGIAVGHENNCSDARVEDKSENEINKSHNVKENFMSLENTDTITECGDQMERRLTNEIKDMDVKSDSSVVAKKGEFCNLELISDNCYENESVSSESEMNSYNGQSGMTALKNFLETEGCEFSGETEFLRFYALPYVNDPKSHPSFQNLFTDTWISDLRAKLNQFLFEHSCGPSVAPQLLQVCNVFHNHKENSRGTTQSVLLSKYQKLRRNYNSLRSDHHNLIGLEQLFIFLFKCSVLRKNTLWLCCTFYCDWIYWYLIKDSLWGHEVLVSGPTVVNYTETYIWLGHEQPINTNLEDCERYIVEANTILAASAKPVKVSGYKLWLVIGDKSPWGSFNRKNGGQSVTGVAAELTDALEKSVTGQEVDLEMTLTNCTKIYPELFKNDLKIRNHPYLEPALGEIHRPLVSQGKEISLSNIMTHFELDFKKIKHHLTSGSVKTKLLLLQALRWRITQNSLEEREAALGAYSRHDVLSLRLNRCQLLATQLIPTDVATPHPLQQAAARLLNTLASLHTGRDYLCSAGRPLIDTVIECISGHNPAVNVDTVTTDMLLAALQKLSLRREQRIFMIDGGLVEWLVQRLEATQHTQMRSYALEYTMALFMNLCLHRQARERCVPFARPLVEILASYLGNSLLKPTPYVTGTLYSLLANHQINQEAKRSGLCDILEHLQKQSTGEVQHQLECLLKRHKALLPDQYTSSEEEITDDDTVELDLLEDELDADDPVTNIHGELCGEALLYQQYRQPFPRHGLVLPSNTLPHAGEPVFRATTPQLQRSQALGHPSNALILENIDSATDGESTKEVVTFNDILSGPLQMAVLGSEVAHSAVQGTTAAEDCSSVCEERENEFTKAFTSRPRIPRTPSTGKPS
ncbi:lisH domain-containing protein ARMC9-like [Schistocerca serialis cubense]|uniref:lisH domain-containing protein ARMC9-like n=1 Tax=Schistocerca serialis cubense TaxID=2023355 RepID=UPI00214E1539|nr:lisH domain-containing protein ARMC9-like [Schistocerca serialis cubense]